MENAKGIFGAYSPKTKGVMIDEQWYDTTDPVREIMEKVRIEKGTEVEYSVDETGEKPRVKFVKATSAVPKSTGGSSYSGGYSQERTDSIMRQTAMKLVVPLVCDGKIEWDQDAMVTAADGFVRYFKTGRIRE